MYEENEYTLTRYYASSPDSLIGRVAPYLRALIGKIEVVHYCCDHVAIAPGGDDDAIKGMSRVLAEYEASKLLDAETGASARIKKEGRPAKERPSSSCCAEHELEPVDGIRDAASRHAAARSAQKAVMMPPFPA